MCGDETTVKRSVISEIVSANVDDIVKQVCECLESDIPSDEEFGNDLFEIKDALSKLITKEVL
jgi:hypothetical protein